MRPPGMHHVGDLYMNRLSECLQRHGKTANDVVYAWDGKGNMQSRMDASTEKVKGSGWLAYVCDGQWRFVKGKRYPSLSACPVVFGAKCAFIQEKDGCYRYDL